MSGKKNRNRYFNDLEAWVIRELQVQLGKSIHQFGEQELAVLMETFDSRMDIAPFRRILLNEYKKPKKMIGASPYLSVLRTTPGKEPDLESPPPAELHDGAASRAVDEAMKRLKETNVQNEKIDKTISLGNELVDRKIDLRILQIDPDYQRVEFRDEKIVEDIMTHWQWEAFHSLLIGEREDGSMWVVDGQHRHEAARRLGYFMIPCKVFKSRGQKHEAHVFYVINKKRVHVNQLSIFKSLLVEGNPAIVEVDRLLKKYNMRMGQNSSVREFKAASTIMRVYKYGVLEKVLSAINDAFSDGNRIRWRKIFCQSAFVDALGIIYANKKWSINEDRMRRVLSEASEVAIQRMLSEVVGTSGSTRGKRTAIMFIDKFYNRNARGGRLNTDLLR